MLVVGILLAWANMQSDRTRYRRAVLFGVSGGIACAVLVAIAATVAREFFSGDALDIFQILLLFLTWALITQMVLWMHAHARHLKAHLHRQADKAGGQLGVALVAGFAVARECIEMVMFLFGAFVQGADQGAAGMAGGITIGIAAASATAVLGVRGARYIRMSWVLRISEGLLLAIAASMLATGIDRVLARDWLTRLADPVWDASAWFNDMHGVGRVFADYVGYRAQPSLLWLLAFATWAALIFWQMRRAPEKS